MPNQLEEEFYEAMCDIYRRAKRETKYNARRFIQMVERDGGLATARYLINAKNVSEGYTALWELKRLDLTVEAMILKNEKYHSLFTEDELEICAERLRQYGYSF